MKAAETKAGIVGRLKLDSIERYLSYSDRGTNAVDWAEKMARNLVAASRQLIEAEQHVEYLKAGLESR